MNLSDPFCHSATLPMPVPALEAFEFLTDTEMMGQWAFGAWGLKPAGDGVFVGNSMFEDLEVYCRLNTSRELLQVDYEVGEDPASLAPRIISKVIPGEHLGRGADTCLVSLIAWRSETVSEERWCLTCASHETEMYRIRHLIEDRRNRGTSET